MSLIANYNSLIKKLNKNNMNCEVSFEDYEIENELYCIRNCLVTLAFMYKDGEFNAMPYDTYFEEFNTK